MKYDILVQTFTSSLVQKQYLPKKTPFLAQKFEEKINCQNPFQAIIILKKKKKIVAWTTKPLV